jgi:hypothetical protein
MLGTFNAGAGATTMAPYLSGNQPAAPDTGAANIASVQGGGGIKSTLSSQPMIMFFAAVAFLLLVKYVSEEQTGMEVAHIHIGGYNFLMISAIAIVGIDLFKLIFTRWQVPGLTPVVQLA